MWEKNKWKSYKNALCTIPVQHNTAIRLLLVHKVEQKQIFPSRVGGDQNRAKKQHMRIIQRATNVTLNGTVAL